MRLSKPRPWVQVRDKYALQQCLRTHQDLCKREGINSPNPSWCFSHCFPLSLPSPDPEQLLNTAVVRASTPLRFAVQKVPSNTWSPILKQLLLSLTALQMWGCAWQSCSTSLCCIPAETAELLTCCSLQLTKPQKNGANAQSPVQLQYVTHKTSNTSLLGEDRNNIKLAEIIWSQGTFIPILRSTKGLYTY